MKDFTGTIYITPQDLHDILMKELGDRFQGCEYSLGPVRLDAVGALEIQIAISDTCHPDDWSTPPWWTSAKPRSADG